LVRLRLRSCVLKLRCHLAVHWIKFRARGLGVNLDFPTLNQRLSDALAGETLVIKGRKVGIRKPDLTGSGQGINARMELAGKLVGTADLRAKVAYDAQQQ